MGASFGNTTCPRMQDIKRDHTQHPIQQPTKVFTATSQKEKKKKKPSEWLSTNSLHFQASERAIKKDTTPKIFPLTASLAFNPAMGHLGAVLRMSFRIVSALFPLPKSGSWLYLAVELRY